MNVPVFSLKIKFISNVDDSDMTSLSHATIKECATRECATRICSMVPELWNFSTFDSAFNALTQHVPDYFFWKC